jgi:hypothetical protein
VPLPAGLFNAFGNLTESLDEVAVEGVANPDFETMDASWLQAMVLWASANGMEAITPFTTLCFFPYGSAGHDKETDSLYNASVMAALAAGQLSSTGKAYRGYAPQYSAAVATSVSSASYATLSSVFTPGCGPGATPCFANQTVAPDSLVSAFGADLATGIAAAPSGASYPPRLAVPRPT